MTVKLLDIVENASAELTAEGWKITRIAQIWVDVTENEEYDIIRKAIDYVVGNVAAINSEHPSFESSAADGTCPLRRLKGDVLDKNKVNVTMFYATKQDRKDKAEDNDDIYIGMQSSLKQVQKSKDGKDGDGTPLTLSFIYGSKKAVPETFKDDDGNVVEDDVTDNGDGTYTHTVTPEIPVDEARRTRTYRFRTGATEEELEAVNDQIQNTVNDSVWRGYDSGTWKCLGMTWETDDGGYTFDVTINLEYSKYGHAQIAAYRHPETGQIPEQVWDSGQPNATQTFEYPGVDFANVTLNGLHILRDNIA